MADHAVADNYDGDVFVYRGGRAPRLVTHVRIDKSVRVLEEEAFRDCYSLLTVETHGRLFRIGRYAFEGCVSLTRINLKSVRVINEGAFETCRDLECVEFGHILETIRYRAFWGCSSLKLLKFPSIVVIEKCAFNGCESITDIEFPERLRYGQTIEGKTFNRCYSLQRIAIPLKRYLFKCDGRYHNQFDKCVQLATVDLVGVRGFHKTISSLHMESWRTEMIIEINRINEVLPTTRANDKTEEIVHWVYSLFDKLDHYKAEHCRYVKEGVNLLELALWKVKLGEKEENCGEGRSKKVKVDAESLRKDKRITCGADVVIKNVLPFLQLE